MHKNSKFHSVYINRLFQFLAYINLQHSKFHSVYINRHGRFRQGDYLILSKFHSVYINSGFGRQISEKIQPQNSILFILIVVSVPKTLLYISSKFHSVYINRSENRKASVKEWSQNSILFILIEFAQKAQKQSLKPQNSILFILIAPNMSGHFDPYCLKIPFCLY